MSELRNILANSNAHFIEAKSGSEYLVSELLDYPLPEGRLLGILYLDQSIESLTCLLSGLYFDHVCLLLDASLSTHRKEELENIYRPNFVFDSADQREQFKKGRLQRIHDKAPEMAGDLKLLLSTSGSTGSPKLVKLSERNIVANATSILEYLPILSSDRVPLNMPLHYSYGFSILSTHLLANASMVFNVGDVISKDFWNAFKTYSFTSLAGVPFFYQMLRKLRFPKPEHSSIRYVTQAGGSLEAEHVIHFHSKLQAQGASLYIMYGQTEATARISYVNPSELPEKASSIGKAIPGGQLEIDPDNGELLYSGDNVFGGYAENLSELATFDKDKQLRTGDLATKDDDGFYYISGRLKRIIKLFGFRINLENLEKELNSSFSKSFYLFGLNDEKLIIASKCSDELLLDAKSYLIESLNILPRFVEVFKLDEIPVLVSGKVNREKIKMLFNDK